MDEIVKTILVYASLAGIIYAAFDRLEVLASNELRQRILLFLVERVNDSKIQQFSSLLDRLFGTKHFSLRCILLSAIISSISTSLIYGAVYLLGIGAEPKISVFYALSFSILILNLFPDYLSLLESRIIIRWIDNGTRKKVLFLLLLDIIITVLIYAIFMVGVIYYFDELSDSDLSKTLKSLFGGTKLPMVVVATFISTFSTSIWIYTYIFGAGITKIGSKTTLGKRILEQFNWRAQPIRVIGSISAIAIFMVVSFSSILIWSYGVFIT